MNIKCHQQTHLVSRKGTEKMMGKSLPLGGAVLTSANDEGTKSEKPFPSSTSSHSQKLPMEGKKSKEKKEKNPLHDRCKSKG